MLEDTYSAAARETGKIGENEVEVIEESVSEKISKCDSKASSLIKGE